MTTAPAATTTAPRVTPDYPAERITGRPRTVHRHIPRAAPLRPHQREAVSAVWRQLRHGGRALVESCCGSGKTVMAAGCARRLAPRGRVLVLVPTIELLQQTATSWSTLGGRRGQAVAACSAREALDVAATHGRIRRAVTTDARLLAQIVKSAPAGPLTVYATYASLEKIVEAHALWGLPAWDLVVVDEAHRTAGAAGKDWAAVHDDEKVPAARRVNFTATVKIAETADEIADGTVYSMDDEAVFGPVVYRLTVDEGINLGLITDYQVLVPVVTDQDLRDLLTLPAINDLRSRRMNAELQELALCIALLRAAKQHGLRRVITFHSRNDSARSFSRALQAAFDLLPQEERPSQLWTRALAGTDSPNTRRKAFDEFSQHSDPDSDELAILSNCRLFGEGVDVPAVDAVVYVDPKSSTVDIIQGLGRAQRLHPRGLPKTARVILPVYLPEGAHDDEGGDPDQTQAAELDRTAFSAAWRVLASLAEHDARVTARIAELRTKRRIPQPSMALQPAEEAKSKAKAGEQAPGLAAPAEAQPEEPTAETTWLHIDARAHQDQILRAIKLRMFTPRSREWERMYERAEAFQAEHGHLDPAEGELKAWLHRQRELRNADMLSQARISELDAIGMIWSLHAAAWERGAAYATAWHAHHSELIVPATAHLDGYALGSWLRRQRKNADALTDGQRQRLDDLDPMWRFDPKWARSYRRLQNYLHAGGTLTGPKHRLGLGDDTAFRPGVWLHQQETQADRLTPDQTALLDALGAWR